MSSTIDERVVSMRFDNQQFERNVNTSIGTLDRLKMSLNMDGAARGLEGINSAVRGFDISPLSKGVESVAPKFSALQVMAVTALANITNTAVDAGKRLVSAFTIEPIKTGFQEFELKMGSVQTIMASTGESLDTVNRYLAELNTYSDKTIYSFSDMTQNIGKFTNAGVKLNDAVAAIKGISNEAAVSGANANEASRAMYNFAQALSAGYVKLIDWKSIENANMATVEFKNELIKTAVELGTVTKKGDMYVTTTTDAKGKVSDLFNATKGFNEALSNQWMTTEVLTQTLGRYADETTEIGKKAYASAQDVKTFSMMMDTLKEAAQSGWAQTWELIVGDFEEGKALWTELSETFSNVIGNMDNARNNLLEGALYSNWRQLTDEVQNAGTSVETFEQKIREVAEANGYAMDEILADGTTLEQAFQQGKISSDVLREAIASLTKQTVDLSQVTNELKFGDKGEEVKMVQQALSDLGYEFGKFGMDGVLGRETEAAIKAFQEANGLEVTGVVTPETLETIKQASGETVNLSESCKGLIDNIDAIGGRQLLIETLRNAMKGVSEVLKVIKDAWREVFPPATSAQLYNIIKALHEFSTKLTMSAETANKLKDTFKGVFAVVDIFVTFLKAVGSGIIQVLSSIFGLRGGFLSLTASIGNWLVGVKDAIHESDIFGLTIGKVAEFIANAITNIKNFGSSIADFISNFTGKFSEVTGITKEWFDEFKSSAANNVTKFFTSISSFVHTAISKIKELGSVIRTAIKENFNTDIFSIDSWKNFLDIVSKIIGILNGVLLGAGLSSLKSGGWVNTLASAFLNPLTSLLDKLKLAAKPVTNILDGVKGCLQSFQTDLKADILKKIAISLGIITASIVVLCMLDPQKILAATIAITTMFGELMGAMAIYDNLNGIDKGVSNSAIAMVALSVAILILANAMKKVGELDFQGIAKGLIGILGITTIMISTMLILDKYQTNAAKGMGQMILFALAMEIFAHVISKFEDIHWESMGKAGAAMTGILGLVAGFNAISKDVKGLTSSMVAITILGAAMEIFADVISKFEDIHWETLGKAGAAMTGILGLAAGFAALAGLSETMLSSMIGLTIMAAAMEIFAHVISKFEEIHWETLGKAGAAMTGILVLSAAFTIFSGISGSMLASATALIVIAAAFKIFVPVMQALGTLKWSEIAKGLTVLAGVFTIIGVAGALLSGVIPSIIGLAGALTLLGIAALSIGAGLALCATGLATLAGITAIAATGIVTAINIIVTGIAGLIPLIAQKLGEGLIVILKVISDSASVIGETARSLLETMLKTLSDCIPMITKTLCELLIGAIERASEYAPQMINALSDLIVNLIKGISSNLPKIVQAGTELIGTILKEIINSVNNMNPDTLVNGFKCIGLISALMLSLSAMIALVPTAMAGVIGVGAVITELTFVISAIGALAQIPGLKWLVNEGGDMLASVGTAIGKFIGGILGGIASGVTAQLPQIGTDLSNFIANVTPFLDKVATIDDSSLSGAKKLVAVIMSITAANLLERVTSWITGGSSFDTFASNLSSFGDAVVGFSEKVAGKIDEGAVTAAASAGSMLAAMARDIPSSGPSVVNFFAGDKDLALFGTQIRAFGSAMVGFSEKVAGKIDEGAVTAAANAGSVLVALAKDIPSSGPSVVGFFVGDKDLATFGTQIRAFGSAMVGFSEKVAGKIDESAVTAAANAGRIMLNLANSLPEDAGALGWLLGEKQDLETFGDNIESFGEALVNFSEKVSEMDTNSTGTVVDICETLIKIAKDVETVDFTKLSEFKKGFDELSKINITEFSDKIADSGSKISESVNTMINSLNESIRSKSGLIKLAYAELFNDVASSITSQQQAFSSAGVALMDALIGSISLRTSAISQTIVAAVTNSAASISNASGAFFNAGTLLISVFIASISAKTGEISNIFTSVASNAVSAITNKQSEFQSAGNALVSVFISAISSKQSEVIQTFTHIITEVVNTILSKKKEFNDAGKALMEEFKKGLESGGNGVSSTITSVLSSCTSALEEGYSSFYDSGTYLVQGFANGMSDNASIAAEAARKVANAAEQAARDALDINSPSKVFREIGKGVPEGFAQGVERNENLVVGSAYAMTSSVVDAAIDGLEEYSIADAWDEQINRLSNSMKVGGEVFKKYAKTFLSMTDNPFDNDKLLGSGSSLISGYFNKKYLNSDEYKQAKKDLEKNDKDMAKNIIKRNQALGDVKQYLPVYTDVASKMSVLRNQIAESEKDQSDTGKENTQNLRNQYLEYNKLLTTMDPLAEALKYKNELTKKNNDLGNEMSKLTEENNKILNGEVEYSKQVLDSNDKKIKQKEQEYTAREKEIRLIDECVGEYDKYNDAVNSGIDSHRNNITTLDENRQHLKDLSTQQEQYTNDLTNATSELAGHENARADILKKLADAGVNLAETEDKEVQAIKDRIFATKDSTGMIKAEDEATKIISQSKEKNIKTTAAQTSANDDYVNGLKEQLAVEDKAIETSKNRVESAKDSLKYVRSEIEKTSDTITEQEEKQAEAIQKIYDDMIENVSNKIKDFINPLKQSIGSGINDMFKTFEGISTVTYSYITDLFSEFDTKTEESASDFIKNMKSQNDAVDKYKENIEKISTMGFDDGLVDYLKSLGISGYKTISVFAKMSEKDINRANEEYQRYLNQMETDYEVSTTDILKSMESNLKGVTNWHKELESLGGLIDEGLMAELRAMGPEAASTINAFTRMTEAELEQANQMFRDKQKLSGQALLDNADVAAKQAEEYTNKLIEMAMKGFSSDILDEIGKMGISEGLEYMTAALTLDQSQIVKLNASQAKAMALPEEIARTVVSSYIYAGSEAADAYRDSLMEGLSGINTTDYKDELYDRYNATETNAILAAQKVVDNVANESGTSIVENVADGVESEGETAKEAVMNTITNCVTSIKDRYSEFCEAGKYLVQGFAQGISENTFMAVAKAKAMANAAYESAMEALDAHSPSRLFMKVGSYVPKGFAIGIEKFSNVVSDSAYSMAETAVSGTQYAIERISDIANSDIDICPTIRPVIDSSSLDSSELRLGANVNAYINRPISTLSQIIADAQSDINDINAKVAESISGLREDINAFYSSDNSEVALYVDSKKLASSIAKPMNRQLNILARRG